jgi:hypothetical protein
MNQSKEKKYRYKNIKYMEENTFNDKAAAAIQKDITTVLTKLATMATITATQDDIQRIRKEVAEIKNVMATKDDVRQIREEVATIKSVMATKDDVRAIREEMAAKEDLRNYATLSDVRTIVSDAKNEILKEMDTLRGRTSRIEEKVGLAPAHA